MLKKNGYLGYITPNSYLKNSSYKDFREFLKEKKILKCLIDFKDYKVFEGFSTYTAITILYLNNTKDSFEYKEFINNEIEKVRDISFNELPDDIWAFSRETIHINTKVKHKISDFFDVQYGFATLRDKVYIGDLKDQQGNLVLFNNHWIEKDILRKIVKGSTYKGNEREIKYIIFPYKEDNNRFVPITETELREKYPHTYRYLLSVPSIHIHNFVYLSI